METNIPEGLQHQSAAYIANWLSSNGFNCVRLTYSIVWRSTRTRKCPTPSLQPPPPPACLPRLCRASTTPLLARTRGSAMRLSTFARVIDELGSKNVMVVLDNHISRAGWCCGGIDGGTPRAGTTTQTAGTSTPRIGLTASPRWPHLRRAIATSWACPSGTSSAHPAPRTGTTMLTGTTTSARA